MPIYHWSADVRAGPVTLGLAVLDELRELHEVRELPALDLRVTIVGTKTDRDVLMWFSSAGPALRVGAARSVTSGNNSHRGSTRLATCSSGDSRSRTQKCGSLTC